MPGQFRRLASSPCYGRAQQNIFVSRAIRLSAINLFTVKAPLPPPVVPLSPCTGGRDFSTRTVVLSGHAVKGVPDVRKYQHSSSP